MDLDGEAGEQINKNHMGENSAIAVERVVESIEAQGPASRTRGVRPDYARLEQASDEEDEPHEPRVKEEEDEEKEDGEAGKSSTQMEESPKVESDGDLSPLSRVPEFPATPTAHFTVEVTSPKLVTIAQHMADPLQNVSTPHDSPSSGSGVAPHTPYFGNEPVFQSPRYTSPGIAHASNHYYPHSNMTSFSTDRNDSGSSLTSSMPPTFSSHSSSSFSHSLLGHNHFSGTVDYFDHDGLEFNGIGSGFEHDIRPGGELFRSEDDNHEEFGALFGTRSE